MFKYEYVTIKVKRGFTSVTISEHRSIIDDYAQKGFRYVGYIPTKESGYGILAEIDLVFENQGIKLT